MDKVTLTLLCLGALCLCLVGIWRSSAATIVSDDFGAAVAINALFSETTNSNSSSNNSNEGMALATTTRQQQQRKITVNDAQPSSSDSLSSSLLKATTSSHTFPSDNKTTSVQEFQRQDGVVIVTKVHGSNLLPLLEQMLCLLHFAYNKRMLYDIVVFTAEPWEEPSLERIRGIIQPVNMTVVIDNRGFQQEVAALSPIRRSLFLQSCNVTSPENLTWWSWCSSGRLSYNWQAEFRSWHIWRHSALRPYRYMMWLDTDAFPTNVWQRDPVAFMILHKLVILFDHFPGGSSRGEDVQERIVASFNKTLCDIKLHRGKLRSFVGGDCPNPKIPQIHGFFHITDLDFYRSDAVARFFETWIGDCFLCRKYDDQAAVTIPAAMLAPHLAWDMRRHGLTMNVSHNYQLDGDVRKLAKITPPSFVRFWKKFGAERMPEAFRVCPVKCVSR